MSFEPIELQREMRRSDPVYFQDLPNTLCLNRAPSAAWAQDFEGFNWNMVGLASNRYPKVVDDGIAIPEVPPSRLTVLLDHIDQAVERVNSAEAARSENLGPDASTTYEGWFDKRPPKK
jgi:hypothetical protein